MDHTLPKLSIVTPSYNQGKYIEQTILSVVGQNYLDLEYIIIDGGSSDNTVDILKKYKDNITYWVSEPDKGQANAINKGFSKATGDIFAWINSDDYYLPGIFSKIIPLLDRNKPQFVSGNVFHYHENTRRAWCGYHSPQEMQAPVEEQVTQPGSFWTRKAWLLCNGVDENSHYTFDWELLLKAKKAHVEFIRTEEYTAVYRMHDTHKSGTGGEKRQQEIHRVYQTYHSEKVAGFYLFVCENADGIKSLLATLKMYKLTRFRKLAFYMKYFKIARKYSDLIKDIDTYLAML